MAFIKRLMHNRDEFQKNPTPYCYAAPDDSNDDLRQWTGYIDGPADSPYHGGRFHVAITFPTDYPFKPPEIRFTTPIFHPNISPKGEICLDLLHSQWSPALSIRALLLSLCSLLTDPNVEHGLNHEALHLYRSDRTRYNDNVRSWIRKVDQIWTTIGHFFLIW